MNELRGGGRPAESAITHEQLHRLEQCLWPDGLRRHLWMIVDAARDRRIFPMLLACHLEYVCLYSGALHPDLELAAPYLVQLDYEYKDTRRLLRESWGNSWGVFLRCDTRMQHLRTHLRSLLVVRDRSGARLMFRYYDPRVLRVYLPTCTLEELQTVFGPIEHFWTEAGETRALLQFTVDRRELLTRTVSLG